ncbi:hypothetical protein ACET3Z_002555 [Daucus carota]
MAFLRISPVSYALTASPTIYAEIVQEMCSPSGEINFTIKSNSCVSTPSVINEALHFPNSSFENIPNGGEIISMLKAINYAADPLGRINTKHFRKEWAYFFVTLSKKKLFATLVTKNPNAEVEFVLPEHVRVQVFKKPRHMTFSCLNLQGNRMIDNSSRVEALTAEMDQCKEAHDSAAEAELRKLEPEKEEPHSD